MRRLRYLCLDIFLRLFLINEPMKSSKKSVLASFFSLDGLEIEPFETSNQA